MNPLKNIICGVAAVVAFTACTEEDYKVYDANQKDSVFFEYINEKNEVDSMVSYSYNYDIATIHTIELPVTLMGVPKDYDRDISIAVNPDSTTMVEGTHYTLSDLIIPAGEVSGIIKINLYRDRDPEILEKEFRLRISVAENDDLRPVGDNAFTVIYSDIRPTLRPGWWLTYGAIPEYSFENAQLFFDYFHRLAPKANLTFYNEMVNSYGMYFDKAPSIRGPFTMYDAFLRNYVFIPLYNDHPELNWLEIPVW